MAHLDSLINKLKDGQVTADELNFVFKLLGQFPNDKTFPRKSFARSPKLHG